MAAVEEQRKLMRDSMVQGELHRIDDVRKRLGDGTYAEVVGQSVVTHTVMLEVPDLVETAEQTLDSLEKYVQEVEQRPDLATRFVRGVRKELTSRRLMGPDTKSKRK